MRAFFTGPIILRPLSRDKTAVSCWLGEEEGGGGAGRFIEWDRKDLRTKVHELNGTFEMNKDSCICECSSKPFCVVRTERSAMSNPKRIHRKKNAKKLLRAKKTRQTSIFRLAFFFAGDVYSRRRQPRRPPSPGRGGDRGSEPLPAAAGGRQAAVKSQNSPAKRWQKNLLKVVSPPMRQVPKRQEEGMTSAASAIDSPI